MTDDGMHICRGEPVGEWKKLTRTPDAAGFEHYRPATNGHHRTERAQNNVSKPPERPTKQVDWHGLAAGFAKMLNPQRKSDLANRLGVPVKSLDLVPLIGLEGATSAGPTFTFPECDASGRIIGILRRLPDGKKFLIKRGQRGLTILTGWRDRSHGPLLIVEGASDTLACSAAGLSVVGQPAAGAKADLVAELLKDWPADRGIIIVAENDRKADGSWPGREGAERSALALTRKLRRPVHIAFPPDGIKDSRAWLTAEARGDAAWLDRGREFLTALEASATVGSEEPCDPDSPTPPTAHALPQNGECWDDPHRIARLFLDKHCTPKGDSTLIQWRDEYHKWNGSAWLPVPDSDLDAALACHARGVFEADYPYRVKMAEAEASGDKPPKPVSICKVTSRTKTDTRLNLSGMVNQPDNGDEPPFWLTPRTDGRSAADVIAAPNGLFTLEDIAAGKPAFADPTPHLFTPTGLPFGVMQSPPTPAVWLKCVREWFDGDEASILGLQEWFGYLLTANTSLQKVLFLIGPPRSGKGTILDTLTKLVGSVNTASITFAGLGQNFGLESLLGKRVAIIPDGRTGKTDTAAVVERLLSISGEDDQSVDRKNRRRITTRLRVRFIIASNETPRLPEASGALASRFHILHTPNSWVGKEDRGLKGKIAAELPGVLVWAAQGWVRLQQQGAFTTNTAADQYANQLADLSSPIRAFVRDTCSVGPEHSVAIPTLFQAWREWNEQRHRESGSEGVFGRDIKAACPHLIIRQPRNQWDGTRTRTYFGIALRERREWGTDDSSDDLLARVGTRSTLTQPPHALPTSEDTEHNQTALTCVSTERVPTRANETPQQPQFSNTERRKCRRGLMFMMANAHGPVQIEKIQKWAEREGYAFDLVTAVAIEEGVIEANDTDPPTWSWSSKPRAADDDFSDTSCEA